MRPVLLLLLLTFSSTLFASECNEVTRNDSTNDIIELQGLAGCKMRASLYLFALSRNNSKEIYKNFYECEGHDVDVNVERFRNKEITNMLVNDVEASNSLEGIDFTNSTPLNKLISRIENRNQVECVEVTPFFSKSKDLYYRCGNSRLKVKVTSYIKCTDSWKSL